MEETTIRGLCFEGTWNLLSGHLGALKAIDSVDLLSKITHFTGSSYSAIIAALCALRASHEYIFMTMSTNIFDLTKKRIAGSKLSKNTISKKNVLGLTSTRKIEGFISNTISGITSEEITLRDIHEKYGTYLCIPLVDVYKTKCEIVYVDYTSHPNMKLKELLISAVSNQWIYKTDSYFSDGSLIDNFPLKKLYEHLKESECVGIRLICENINETKDRPKDILETSNSYIKTLFNTYQKIEYNYDYVVRVESVVESIGLDITPESKKQLYSTAYSVMLEYINKSG